MLRGFEQGKLASVTLRETTAAPAPTDSLSLTGDWQKT